MADTPTPSPAAIALGSNVDSELGDRAAHLAFAREQIALLPGISVTGVSADYETAAVGRTPQADAGGPYLNAAMTVWSPLPPRQLLEALLEIERARGRDRSAEQRWGPRTLDLDLLLYADLILSEPNLELPHPRLHQRAFVLIPLHEIAADWVVPGQDRTVADLLAGLSPETDPGPSAERGMSS